jgi:hypothetical protein
MAGRGMKAKGTVLTIYQRIEEILKEKSHGPIHPCKNGPVPYSSQRRYPNF